MNASRSLYAHQRALVDEYLSGSAPRVVALDAPPGTGKSLALAVIATQRAAEGGLIIVVVHRILVSQWVQQIRNVGGSPAAVYASPSDFRLALDEGSGALPTAGIVVCGSSVARAPLAVKALLESSPSLLIVDDLLVSRSSELGRSLRALADRARQVIFTGFFADSQENIWFPPYEKIRWKFPLTDHEGRRITPHVTVRVRDYAGDPVEAEVIREAIDLLRFAGYPRLGVLLTRTAIQFALLRLAQRLEIPEQSLLLRGDLKESEPEQEWTPIVREGMIDETWVLLDRFDDLAPDKRLDAVIAEVRLARDEDRPLVIVANLAQEVDYLVAATRSPEIQVSAVTGGTSSDEILVAAEELRRGNVLVVTSAFFAAIQRPLPNRTRSVWFTPPRSGRQLQQRLGLGISSIGAEIILLKATPPVTPADELVNAAEVMLQNPWREQGDQDDVM